MENDNLCCTFKPCTLHINLPFLHKKHKSHTELHVLGICYNNYIITTWLPAIDSKSNDMMLLDDPKIRGDTYGPRAFNIASLILLV